MHKVTKISVIQVIIFLVVTLNVFEVFLTYSLIVSEDSSNWGSSRIRVKYSLRTLRMRYCGQKEAQLLVKL